MLNDKPVAWWIRKRRILDHSTYFDRFFEIGKSTCPVGDDGQINKKHSMAFDYEIDKTLPDWKQTEVEFIKPLYLKYEVNNDVESESKDK